MRELTASNNTVTAALQALGDQGCSTQRTDDKPSQHAEQRAARAFFPASAAAVSGSPVAAASAGANPLAPAAAVGPLAAGAAGTAAAAADAAGCGAAGATAPGAGAPGAAPELGAAAGAGAGAGNPAFAFSACVPQPGAPRKPFYMIPASLLVAYHVLEDPVSSSTRAVHMTDGNFR